MMFATSDDDLHWLRSKWQALTTSVGVPQHKATPVLEDLILHYSEPTRAYHNLSHIAALLRHADAYRHEIKNTAVIEFSIWFHDVIYDTRAKDNEEQSTVWARQALRSLGTDEGLIVSVQPCILATRTHEVIPGVDDLPLFLDFDLAILGASPHIYREYSAAIRTEYDWVPAPIYREGRMKVLQRFTDRPSLYFSSSMRDRFELPARRNLEWELQQLSSD